MSVLLLKNFHLLPEGTVLKFERTLNSKHLCRACRSLSPVLFRDPDGHGFCLECKTKNLNNGIFQCPMFGTFSENDIYLDDTVYENLKEERVICSSCDRRVRLKEMAEHVSECPTEHPKYESVRPKTKMNIFGKNVEKSHNTEEAEKSQVDFPGENTVASLPCPFNCGRKLSKPNLVHHIKNECPERIIKCDHCLIEIKGSDEKSHILSCEVLNKKPEVQEDENSINLISFPESGETQVPLHDELSREPEKHRNIPPEPVSEPESPTEETKSEDSWHSVSTMFENDDIDASLQNASTTRCPLCANALPTNSIIEHMKLRCKFKELAIPKASREVVENLQSTTDAVISRMDTFQAEILMQKEESTRHRKFCERDFEEIRNEIQNLKDEVEKLKTENTSLKEEINKIREETTSLMTTRNQEMQELQTQVQYLLEENKHMQVIRLQCLQAQEKDDPVNDENPCNEKESGSTKAEEEEDCQEVSSSDTVCETSLLENDSLSYEDDEHRKMKDFLVTEYAKETEVSLTLIKYSLLKELSLKSPEKYIKKSFLIAHKHRFRVIIYPCGVDSWAGNHLSIFLSLPPDNSKKPIKWNFRNKIYVIVKNSLSSCDNICEQVRTPPKNQENVDSLNSFLEVGSLHIPHEQLEDDSCRFVNDDTMNIQLHFYLRYDDDEFL